MNIQSTADAVGFFVCYNNKLYGFAYVRKMVVVRLSLLTNNKNEKIKTLNFRFLSE